MLPDMQVDALAFILKLFCLATIITSMCCFYLLQAAKEEFLTGCANTFAAEEHLASEIPNCPSIQPVITEQPLAETTTEAPANNIEDLPAHTIIELPADTNQELPIGTIEELSPTKRRVRFMPQNGVNIMYMSPEREFLGESVEDIHAGESYDFFTIPNFEKARRQQEAKSRSSLTPKKQEDPIREGRRKMRSNSTIRQFFAKITKTKTSKRDSKIGMTQINQRSENELHSE